MFQFLECGQQIRSFKTGELPYMFPGLRTVHYEEPIAMPDFAPKPARVVRFCALKPESN